MHLQTRNFFTTITAALALVATAACSDDKGGSETGSSSGTGTGDATTSGTSTTGTTPPTTGATDTGSDDSGSGSGTEAATSTTGEVPTTGEATTTSTDPGTETGDPGTTSTGPGTETGSETGDPLQQCLMMIDPGDACGECACTSCTTELVACQMDEGCTAIRMCAQESGCGGIDCLGPCGETIDMYGGFGGESAQKGIALGGCIEDNCGARCSG